MNSSFQNDDFKYSEFYRGLVVDNIDSEKLGRIKVRVYGVFGSNIPSVNLPWAVPASNIFTGAGSDYGSFAVPEISSQVFVFFEKGDIYQPVYFAEASTAIHGLPSERIINYPFRKVYKTKNGLVMIIDDAAKEIYLNHPSGSYLKIDTDGNITISGKNVIVQGDIVNINPS